MCRFIIIKSAKDFSPLNHLKEFSKICRSSEEFQGHGWGICYLSDGEWKGHKSIKPIWEEEDIFTSFPKTRIFVAHARSAFGEDTISLENTQPLQYREWLFVFNGEIRGVKLSVEGSTGAHKIFNLIKNYLKNSALEEAILKTKDLIEKNSKYVKALNLGLVNKRNAYMLCRYNEQREYFTIYYHKEYDMSIVCSQSYGGYDFKPMNNNQIIII